MSLYDGKTQLAKERKAQAELKKKYEITEERVVVKETSNMGKFLIRTGAMIIRVLATIGIAILAALGIIALAYPHIRVELIREITDVILGLF